MFSKILIANRGEIACRVIKSARKMGIKTVAVYSDADKAALHVQMADEAVHIGPAPTNQSYLIIERIIEACKSTGAEAVHPGYGFLSENQAFAKALDAANIAFIGPPNGAIAAMGDKITSKKIAADAGVSTVPGYMGVIKDTEEAIKIANEIGYPVMLKASAGGGGKGMRIARNDAECREGFERATSEAASSFGDDRVFVEKFVEEPRHIEIQVLADKHGNAIYLGERECSIQRRHQKVVEEAPSPFIDPATRKAMGEQAVALARAVDYCSAGTVEFIVDKDKNFYFLEMNTRLQVEHPVTELVTGQDLVEWMIKIADGQELTLKQDDVTLTGWAMETRVYAEDPFREFLPSTGRLVKYQPPEESATVRVDTGVYEGGEISMYYDPMVAKLITYGETRDQAIDEMRAALDGYYIRGISHNIPFLAAVMANKRFQDANITTNFIAEEYPDGFSSDDLPDEDPSTLVVVAAYLNQRYAERNSGITGQISDHPIKVAESWVAVSGDDHTPFDIEFDGVNGDYIVAIGDRSYGVVSDWKIGNPMFVGEIDGAPVCVQIDIEGIGFRLASNGVQRSFKVLLPRVAELQKLMPFKAPPDMSNFLQSPMPGLLVKVSVTEGQTVQPGQELCILEAMKMENVLKAESKGVVKKIHAEQGANLSVDAIIIEFEKDE
ncbi:MULTISPECIES: acetyl-CoA carboxylase biotin carboxylase subunit [Thalassospira]|uniref:Biotin carboxylase n=2 Tax=Thalassospira TaxID=168934 RepID=A0A367W6A1_9PROT|nr:MULTISPECIES: acetyl-CoA carboxylase biotin carboxylase subunit [Thalassospira]MDG4719008.1 acetyl-CoA carboxylase biotin carboxylase subunit [Thalassospira sp. FZY0004]RCK36958.1 acetyl-CoA carboxylase [Thalassospira profundimaris]